MPLMIIANRRSTSLRLWTGPCNMGLRNVSNLCWHNGIEVYKKKVTDALAAGQTVHPDTYKMYSNRTKEINPNYLYKCRPYTYNTNASGDWVRHQKSPSHKNKNKNKKKKAQGTKLVGNFMQFM
ncbi:hypothetical protein FSST1_004073 [Fusarium sambucinum]